MAVFTPTEIHAYDRRWYIIDAQIPTSDLSSGCRRGVFRTSFPRNPFSPLGRA
jgi:hypothetical protein